MDHLGVFGHLLCVWHWAHIFSDLCPAGRLAILALSFHAVECRDESLSFGFVTLPFFNFAWTRSSKTQKLGSVFIGYFWMVSYSTYPTVLVVRVCCSLSVDQSYVLCT